MITGAEVRRQRAGSLLPPTRRSVIAVAAAVAVLVATAAIAVTWRGAAEMRFAVVDRGDGKGAGDLVYERAVEPGETFVLEHTHSVTRRLVRETFSVLDGETIALEELWFDEFGPNLPAGPEVFDHDVTWLREDGAFRVLHHRHPIGVVPLRVGSATVDHTLTFADGQRVRLLDIAPRGAWVDLIVRT
ncbi:MAG TPA: DUF1850 domain-containing protein [Jiangellaceae bacterium]